MAVSNLTPMMRQYNQLKQQYKDKILLFRMGDFFETFGDDAKVVARVLNITLTARDKNEDPTPLAGFPHHALNQYLPKLIKAGLQVAIADQVEDPKLAKGIVRREITRVVTPGTLTDESAEELISNRFIVSLYNLKGTYGLAACDLSTGECLITESTSEKEILDECSRLHPAEIIVPINQNFAFLSQHIISVNENFTYSEENQKDILTAHFNVKNLASLVSNARKAAISASAGLIAYLQDTQRSELSHIASLTYYDIKGAMVLDEATIRNLDLIESTSDHGKKNSLFHVLNHCSTSAGMRKLRSWILHPLLDHSQIKERLSRVNLLYQNAELLNSLQESLKQVSDLERLLGRIAMNRANARDLIALAHSLEQVDSIQGLIAQKDEVSLLHETLYSAKPQIQELIDLINRSIVNDPPIQITEGGIIKSGYSKEIDVIRNETAGSSEWIRSLQEAERKRTGIPSLKVRMNKVFGYYIEITNTHKDKIPENYIRKQTLVNGERYITEELKEKEEIVMNAQAKLSTLEYEVFQDIRQKLLIHVQTIQRIAQTLSTLDVLGSLALSARLHNYVRPSVLPMGEKDSILIIKNGRHPVVERTINEPFIQNDLSMDQNNQRLIILTGPNMSGKSTYIRQMAIIILMAQMGSFVPAQSAEIALVDRIFTRVGASDDLSAGRSTFMVEMDEAAYIVKNATEHSFIVLDEVGRGTSTYDGVSIAWAIAEYIHDSVKARCLFATHYHELLKLEEDLDATQNYNVAVLEEGNDVVFLRKIEKGGTDRSYGIYVAQMAGLPQSVIDRANEILSGFEQEAMFSVKGEPQKKKETVTEPSPEIPHDKNAAQLSFIGGESNDHFPTLVKEIKDLDVNAITPLHALHLIEKWKKRLNL